MSEPETSWRTAVATARRTRGSSFEANFSKACNTYGDGHPNSPKHLAPIHECNNWISLSLNEFVSKKIQTGYSMPHWCRSAKTQKAARRASKECFPASTRFTSDKAQDLSPDVENLSGPPRFTSSRIRSIKSLCAVLRCQ